MNNIFEWSTEFREPQVWICLNDGTSLEITHEEYGIDNIADQYYTARLHCSEEDFENDIYHDTMGIIAQTCGDIVDILNMVLYHVQKRGVLVS
jgi:hypothetical protein